MTDRPTGRTEQQTDDGRTDRVMGNYVCSTVINGPDIHISEQKGLGQKNVLYIGKNVLAKKNVLYVSG